MTNGAGDVHLEVVGPIGQQEKGRANAAAEHELICAPAIELILCQ